MHDHAIGAGATASIASTPSAAPSIIASGAAADVPPAAAAPSLAGLPILTTG
ncbi:MAG TPA: hypothetical protein VI916_02545 [Acidimicrobiia bacterium]|nr:hypothetical protein [Acidimicrobiia bacterium]